jgi:hypothetical protein|tara:strand:- start:857 stop:1105 length:249 start_codon:yes stop_codon:yes gene_type:complete
MKPQQRLFDDQEPWEEEWVGMPEFIQEQKKPFAKLVIRFETEDDLKEFAILIDQKITSKTKSIWHPFKSHWGLDRKVYKDES